MFFLLPPLMLSIFAFVEGSQQLLRVSLRKVEASLDEIPDVSSQCYFGGAVCTLPLLKIDSFLLIAVPLIPLLRLFEMGFLRPS